MRRQKRPYFTFVVFATLLAFGLFLAWQSSILNKQMSVTRSWLEGRTLYLPYIGNMPCSQPPCQPASPTSPAYPTRFGSNYARVEDITAYSRTGARDVNDYLVQSSRETINRYGWLYGR